MDEDTRPEEAKRLEAVRKRRGFRSARAATEYFGWNYNTYSQHERGLNGLRKETAAKYAKAFRTTAAWLLTGEGGAEQNMSAAVVGYIGAGAEVLPEFEQVPPEGLETIDLPFAVPDGIVAFKVRGDSMLPSWREGDAVLVWQDQRLATDNYVGERVAVRTGDGKRYLKELQRGHRRGLFNLYSHNARLIEDVEIEWVGEIYVTVHEQTLRRTAQQMRAQAIKSHRRRAEATFGMEELPLDGE